MSSKLNKKMRNIRLENVRTQNQRRVHTKLIDQQTREEMESFRTVMQALKMLKDMKLPEAVEKKAKTIPVNGREFVLTSHDENEQSVWRAMRIMSWYREIRLIRYHRDLVISEGRDDLIDTDRHKRDEEIMKVSEELATCKNILVFNALRFSALDSEDQTAGVKFIQTLGPDEKEFVIRHQDKLNAMAIYEWIVTMDPEITRFLTTFLDGGEIGKIEDIEKIGENLNLDNREFDPDKKFWFHTAVEKEEAAAESVNIAISSLVRDVDMEEAPIVTEAAVIAENVSVKASKKAPMGLGGFSKIVPNATPDTVPEVAPVDDISALDNMSQDELAVLYGLKVPVPDPYEDLTE